jgi:outer membrane protein TolC
MRKSILLLAALAAGAPRALPAQTAPAAPGAPAARRDTVSVSLEEALSRALTQSNDVRLAESEVRLAATQVTAARSAALPQLSANLGYTRTFQSPFGGGGGISIPDSLRFSPDSTAPLAERVA